MTKDHLWDIDTFFFVNLNRHSIPIVVNTDSVLLHINFHLQPTTDSCKSKPRVEVKSEVTAKDITNWGAKQRCSVTSAKTKTQAKLMLYQRS
jgi:hypothetical protein